MLHSAFRFALMMFAPALAAQTSFVEITPTSDPYFNTNPDEDFWVNAVAPADYDGDGRIDLAVLGFYVVYNESVEDKLILFHNDGEAGDGSWAFTSTEVPLGGVVAGASDLAWGDFDNDGDYDLAIGSEGVTALFRNDAGTLTAMPVALPGYYEDSTYEDSYDLRSLTWADVDNDGDLDLLIPSVYNEEDFTFRTALMRNDGSDGLEGWVFTETGAALDATVHAQSAWSDVDGDGDLDLFMANVDPYTESGFIKLYANDAGAFTATDPLGLRVEHGLADIGDADGDGDQDLLVAGNIEENEKFSTVLRIYFNDGGTFAPTTLFEAPSADWLDIHAATWADYDSDGDVDLLVTGNFIGETDIEGKSEIYVNEGGAFAPLAETLPAPIGSVGRGGAFTWFDIDGDGDLDYLVAGAFFVPDGNGLVEAKMRLFRNASEGTNTPPESPDGLRAEETGEGVALAWNVAADDHTPGAQLTYDLELWRDGVPVTLPERLPEPGNISTSTRWTIADLPDGSYTWRVRAVDSAYAGSIPAEGAFTLPFGADTIFANGFEIASEEI
jgi:hypothetical protein